MATEDDPFGISGIAGRWRWEKITLALAPGSFVQFLKPDSERWSVIIPSASVIITAYPYTVSTTISTGGLAVPANGFPLQLTYRDHGGLVQSEWWLAAAGAGVTAAVYASYWR